MAKPNAYIGFYWKDRKQSLRECLGCMHGVLSASQIIFGAPEQFLVSSATKPVPRNLGELASPTADYFGFLIDKSLRLERSSHSDDPLDVYSPVGFIATWFFGNSSEASVRFCIGAFGPASAGNAIVISADESLLQPPLFREVWEQLLVLLDPDFATVTSHELADCIDDGTESAVGFGWISYVRTEVPMAGDGPRTYRAVGNGTEFSVEPNRMFSTDPETIELIRIGQAKLIVDGAI